MFFLYGYSTGTYAGVRNTSPRHLVGENVKRQMTQCEQVSGSGLRSGFRSNTIDSGFWSHLIPANP